MLYHFSEEDGIEKFAPRLGSSRPDLGPVVWSIDELHAPLYFFPRDCPRIACWPLPTSSEKDVDWYHAQTDARMIIAVENDWLERLRNCRLYRYTFETDGWEPLHDHGCHLARQAVKSVTVGPVGDLLTMLADAGVELRVTPSLWPAWNSWTQTSLHWSGIRLRNASARKGVSQ